MSCGSCRAIVGLWLQPRIYTTVLTTLLILVSVTHYYSTASAAEFQFQLAAGASNFTLQSDNNSIATPSWSDNNQWLWLTPNPDTTKTQLQGENAGRVVYNQPLPLFNLTTGEVLSFNSSFTFKIVTAQPYSAAGDGLAFSISPNLLLPINSTGGSLGLVTTNVLRPLDPDAHLFAVEFDTFMNRPYSDPSSSHIGIDFNGLISNATLNTNSTDSPLYLYANYTLSVWVEYIAPLHLTQVFASNSGVRPSQATLNVTYNLSDLFGSYSNQSLYAAISAATGALVQGSALSSWTFAIEDVNSPTAPPLAVFPGPSRPAVVDPSVPGASGRRSLVLPLTLSLSASLLLGAAACMFLALFHRRKKRMGNRRGSSQPAIMEMIPPDEFVPRHSYRALKKATQGFSEQQKVGEGGFSSVYKGTLSTGGVVAVKRLKEGLRMEEEFVSEIQIISRIRHRNLLQLKGWGYERGEALLVYQYMPNGSLDSYLFGKKKRDGVADHELDGSRRFKILMGVAAALEYLHEGVGECVLHRDVKAANVMLTEEYEAKLGDFGLARLIKHDQVVTMTAVGTPGYVAPEVVFTGKATDKADVYSFGILALEVACGRRVLDGALQPQEMRLLDWVWLLQQSGKLVELALDPACKCSRSNGGDQNTTTESKSTLQWQCVLHVAMLCCNPWPEDRPSMRQVHQTLRECIVLPLPSTMPSYRSPSSSTILPSIESLLSSSSSSTLLSSDRSSISLASTNASSSLI